ncbi:MAG: NERD domain-containing protein [Nitrospirae bacterium]|nr:NERD domain-containing protein [Nitrospirota bacterium]
MAVEIGKAGKSVREIQEKLFQERRKKAIPIILTIIPVILIICTYIITIFITGKINLFYLLGALTIYGAIMLFIKSTGKNIDKLIKTEQNYKQGAEAEEEIGNFLKQLSCDYTILHDIEYQHGNIDHVVEYKKGEKIFAIETKSHKGTVTSDGTTLYINKYPNKKNFISQATSNAVWLSNQLKEKTGIKKFVIPIIVFTNAEVEIDIKTKIKQVHVVHKKDLVRKILWLSKQ